MRAHVRVAMDEGAMGLTTALIYIPGVFAKTDELVELAKVASASGGMYISHMRSEGNRLLEAIDETLTIAREAKIRAEIYHLKESGESNWNKLDAADREDRERARRRGSRSRPTCTPTPPARPASTRRCRRGCRRAATRPGRRGCRIRRFANASAAR